MRDLYDDHVRAQMQDLTAGALRDVPPVMPIAGPRMDQDGDHRIFAVGQPDPKETRQRSSCAAQSVHAGMSTGAPKDDPLPEEWLSDGLVNIPLPSGGSVVCDRDAVLAALGWRPEKCGDDIGRLMNGLDFGDEIEACVVGIYDEALRRMAEAELMPLTGSEAWAEGDWPYWRRLVKGRPTVEREALWERWSCTDDDLDDIGSQIGLLRARLVLAS